MIALSAYLPQIAGPIHDLANLYTNFRVGMVSLRRVDDILSLSSEWDDAIAKEPLALEKGKLGETYNIGGRNERENLYIANIICELLDEMLPKSSSYKKQISFVKDRPGHDFRYAIDASKIENNLDWKAKENFETGIQKTISWYLKNRDRL